MEKVIRYDCEDNEFEGVFVEIAKSWSRREVRESWDATIENLIPILSRKIITLYLPRVDGEPITRPQDLTFEATEDIDSRLFQWLMTAWVKHMNGIADLGKALGRTLYVSSDSNQSPEKTPEKTKIDRSARSRRKS